MVYVYSTALDRMEGKDNMQFTSIIRCQKSFDGGKTWAKRKLFPGRGQLLPSANPGAFKWSLDFGNWICTDSVNGLEGDPTAFRISDDEGRTWKKVDMPESNGAVHANVVELEGGKLVCFLRSRFADNIYISEIQRLG